MNMDAVKFQLGEMVYRKLDGDQVAGMVTGIVFRPIGILYMATFGAVEDSYYDIELSADKNFVENANT